MKKETDTLTTFLTLLRSGLWEQSAGHFSFEMADLDTIYQIAEEQSIVGLIAAGLEQVEETKVPQSKMLPFLANVISLEQRNQEMDLFIGGIVEKMKEAAIYVVLVKGQGIAQCYERPLWRCCGDVDFLLEESNYKRAKSFLLPLSSASGEEGNFSKHLALTIDPWEVELHGTLRCGLSSKMDRVIDAIQRDTFSGNDFRVWNCGETKVYLPGPNNDIIFVFTHILKHFYKGGIGLRQICDWCRLLWTYRKDIDSSLLTCRLQEMGLTSEWKAFAAVAVDYLGMPVEAMPLHDSSARWSRKANRIMAFIMEVGNFGHNRDMSYYVKYPFLIRKAFSAGRRLVDLYRHAAIFPLDSLRFSPSILKNGLRSAIKID